MEFIYIVVQCVIEVTKNRINVFLRVSSVLYGCGGVLVGGGVDRSN